MKVFERIADAFVAEGTRAVFTLIGDGNMFWLNAMNERGVKLINVRHEGAGLGMADGWARATREVGVASTTNGPGVPQLATALITATRAASPVVVFVGESETNHPEHIQRMDQAAMCKACEAEYVRIESPETVDCAARNPSQWCSPVHATFKRRNLKTMTSFMRRHSICCQKFPKRRA